MRKMTLALLLSLCTTSVFAAEPPETVLVTFRPSAGNEAALESVLARHWEVLTRLDLVADRERHAFRGTDAAGKRYVVELLTWKSASIPDNPPAEVLAVWKEMHQLGTLRIEEVEPLR